jgi:hypothetical protein
MVPLRARYDRAGRAVEPGDSGDVAGAYFFDYGPMAAALSPRTVVTDPAGAKTVRCCSRRYQSR